MSIKDRARVILRGGAHTIKELATEMDEDTESVRRTIARYSGENAKFVLFVRLADGRYRLSDWGKK